MKNAPWLLLAVLCACSSSGSKSRDAAGSADGVAGDASGSDGLDAVDDVSTPADTVQPEDTTTTDVTEPEDTSSVDVEPPDTALPDLSVPDTGPELPNDNDSDGVPDDLDLFPTNPALPGTVVPGKVYAQTATTLFTMDVKTYAIVPVGDFSYDDGQLYKVTDIAIDRYGVLYAVAYDMMFTCNPDTAACTSIGVLPASFNALSWIPAGLIDAGKDVMVGAADGIWYRLDRDGSKYVAKELGSFGGDYSSSGDVFSIAGIGTYATVNKGGSADDFIVEVDPKTGAVVREVGQTFGYGSLFGVAGWTDRVFAFDSSGRILIVDINDGKILKELAATENKWWGAGVPTVIPDP